jgi:hypothetical protein
MSMDPLPSISTNEFDYNILLNCLDQYKYPRNKIGSLLKSGKKFVLRKASTSRAMKNTTSSL